MRRSQVTGINQSSILRISSIYPSLTKSEKKVADIVLKDPETAVFYTITDLSKQAEVGDTSVIRFCRKLGYSGYQEFKLSLAQNLGTVEEQISGALEPGDDLETIVKKLNALNQQRIQNTTALMDGASLQKAIEWIGGAAKLYFFGVGSSGITAMDAKYKFMRLGFQVVAEADAHIIAMNAALAGEGDVVIAISASGSTKDLVDSVAIAKQKGARIICLTSHALSPVTRYADAVLLTVAKEGPLQGGSFASKLAQIHVLDILSTALALLDKERSYRFLEMTAKSVLGKLY
ncbi:putative HTH-type transcriptional regulator [Paenibacillus dendritiformis]|uniref:MurR/RpiR family transcriptional regulator n=2 Tax=Paenibacillus TaxID=44249 RepID=UPI00143D6052|nr:MurR/RpiR family transcriptional regulator [Paenibacillus dendritiformis]NKI20044.1 MurR/RpiR family transcriptional regulator [Paenibacillus dendritiformis]NRF98283.1 MurR/RpiR family transcriptional regulator [Paenibacillus dendritiformis]GIO75029.1 putative HTH-type transcriptional regulator [Paenibacillus dendritiformis]